MFLRDGLREGPEVIMSKPRELILILTSGRPSRTNYRFSYSLSYSLVRLFCFCALLTQMGCDEESLKKFGESLNQDCIETAVALDEALSKEGRLEEENSRRGALPNDAIAESRQPKRFISFSR